MSLSTSASTNSSWCSMSETFHTDFSRCSMRMARSPHCALHGTPWMLPGLHTRSPWDFMEAARSPPQDSMGLHGCWLYSVPLLHGTPWMLAVLRSTDTNVADRNRYYTSTHHVSTTDQNCADLKRAENVVRHVEMWSVVRQKGTVRASRKMGSGLKGSVTKSCKFTSRVKHHKQRKMLASPLGCGRSDQSRLTLLLSGS